MKQTFGKWYGMAFVLEWSVFAVDAFAPLFSRVAPISFIVFFFGLVDTHIHSYYSSYHVRSTDAVSSESNLINSGITSTFRNGLKRPCTVKQLVHMANKQTKLWKGEAETQIASAGGFSP